MSKSTLATIAGILTMALVKKNHEGSHVRLIRKNVKSIEVYTYVHLKLDKPLITRAQKLAFENYLWDARQISESDGLIFFSKHGLEDTYFHQHMGASDEIPSWVDDGEPLEELFLFIGLTKYVQQSGYLSTVDLKREVQDILDSHISDLIDPSDSPFGFCIMPYHGSIDTEVYEVKKVINVETGKIYIPKEYKDRLRRA